ncbi:PAS domain S-box protein [Sphingomonas yunnanensis]|uniref:PAS domain S-box protein n=1 Tax=Sphingomonas yunnanensis TaxID=310400 RepID=UPI001CA79AEB|nr:PAS domain S-box protein [Sphingomonas yunnanensis]MBY9063353.1 PAS domain S-box protein [Sphingomonas yunnanensis]
MRDWSSHPLGLPDSWPVALQLSLGTVLHSPESMCMAWGPELTFFFNDAYLPILGPRVDGAMGARFAELWADVWQQVEPIVHKALGGVASRYDDLPLTMARFGRPEQTWWTFSYSPLFDESGAVGGMLCIANEQTARVAGEARLRASEGRARQIIDSALDYAIIATDPEGHITCWNEGARRTLGWTEEEMLGQPADRFFTPEDVAAGQVAKEMHSALETGKGKDERWHQRKGGDRFWADGEMTVLKDEADRAIGFVKVLRDRTARRLDLQARQRLEDELRRLNAQLTTDVNERTAERDRLWDTSPDLLLIVDFDGIVQAVNPAWTTMLGYEPSELLDQSISNFVHPEDHALTEKLVHDAAGRPLISVENRYTAKDGSYRWISWVSVPGEDVIYATGRDVTRDKEAGRALRHAEEQLRQSQKVEAVGQLTGGVAHDFNNLLTVIRGSIDLLRRPDVPEERRKRYIDAISDTADRAAKLTGQLLAFARRQTLRPTVFDTRKSVAVIEDMIRTLTGSRIEVEVIRPDEPCMVNADPSQFDTALVNMAVNARDAMGGSGRLTIEVRRATALPAMRAHPAVEGEFVAVSLTDTGAGILPEKIDQIFEPFFTTKDVGQGTGLGLSQVFGFAKQSGGEIDVESRPGEGATFTLYLPRSMQATEQAEPESDAEANARGNGAFVLIVEDNPEVGNFATQALQELGYDTRLASDAQKALAALRDSGSGDGSGFDVVFSDVVMPGMSGIELGQEVRRLYPDLPVVLTSGYSTVLAQNGTHGFELLQKPYSMDELSRVLRKAAAWRERAHANAPQMTE